MPQGYTADTLEEVWIRKEVRQVSKTKAAMEVKLHIKLKIKRNDCFIVTQQPFCPTRVHSEVKSLTVIKVQIHWLKYCTYCEYNFEVNLSDNVLVTFQIQINNAKDYLKINYKTIIRLHWDINEKRKTKFLPAATLKPYIFLINIYYSEMGHSAYWLLYLGLSRW